MPVDAAMLARARGAAAELAIAQGQSPTNSVLSNGQMRLSWLTDRFLVAPPFPFPTVFSVGDLLIGLGVAWVIAAGMRATTSASVSPSNSKLAA